MAIQIQLRRGTASQWTTANTLLAQGELGLETDTNKFKFGDGVTTWNSLPYYANGSVTSVALSGGTTGLTVTGSPITTSGTITLGGTLDVDNGGTGQTSYTDGQLLIGNTTGNTLTKTTLTAGSGIAITNGSGSISIAATNSGTVTAVTGTSPVASSGGATPAISLSANYGDTLNPYASKTANYVLAAPNGTAGVPTFRAIVAADIPTLNQNTTGTASNVTGTVAIANGGSGQTTAQLAMNAFAGAVTSGSYLRGNGTNVVMSTIQAADVPTLNQNTTGTASNVTGTVAIANGGTGQTTQQAALTALSGTQASGQYLRSNGTNTLLSAIQAADVPTLNQNTTGTAANITATSNSTLTTLSSLSLPGSQVSGNISGNAANVTGTVAIANGGTGQTTQAAALTALTGTQTSGYYVRSNGTNSVLAAIQAADVPTLNQNTTGTASNVTGTVAIANGGTGQTTASAGFNALSPITSTGDLIIGNGTNSATRLSIGTNGYVLTSNGTTASWVAASSGSGTVTSVAATVPSFLSVTGSPITTSGTLAIALASTPTNGQLLIGNGTGFSYSTLTAGSNITITNSAGGITIASSGGGGSSSPIPKLLSWSIGGF